MTIVTVDQLMIQCQQLRKEAFDILSNPQTGAEDVGKAEKMIKDADQLSARAANLKELEMQMKSTSHLEQPTPQQASGFKNFEEFVTALVDSRSGKKHDARLQKHIDSDETRAMDGAGRSSQKALNGGALADGGALIPIEQLTEIMAVAAPQTIVRSRATIQRMSRRQLDLPLVDQTGTTTGIPAYFGGIQTYWIEEGQEITDTQAKWRKATLTAWQLGCYVKLPNTLIDDAVGLVDFLSGSNGIPGAIAYAEDYAFLRGSGVNKPQGIINSPARKSLTRTTANTVKWDDIVAMESGFFGSNPVYVATMGMKATLMNMSGPINSTYMGMFLWGNAEKGMPETFMGRQILFTDKLPGVGTEGDIMLTDFGFYTVGDRRATTMDLETSTHENFKYNVTAIRAIHRVDGQPRLSAPISLNDAGGLTVSPFVVVAA